MEIDQSQVKEYIKEWANSESEPHFAVLINGAWGCGKTHFIKSVIEDKEFTEKQIAYISMFGISSIKTLETQLFLETATNISKWAFHGLNLTGAMANGIMKFDLNNDGEADASVNATTKNFGEQIKKYSKKVNDSIVIFDDIERCKIPMADLLGVINRLVEHSDARVILIANTERFTDEEQNTDFTSFKEKIVGQSFKLTSQPNEALTSFCASIKDDDVRAIVESQQSNILENYVSSGYHNVRALRYFVWFLEQLLSNLDSKYHGNKELIDNLIQQAFVFFMELKLELSDEPSQLSPESLVEGYADEDVEGRHLFDYSDLMHNQDNEISPRKKILKKYQLHNGFNCVITRRQWAYILESGVIDKVWFNEEIAQSQEVAGVDGWSSWKRLWYFHEWDFNDESSKEFDSDVEDVISKLKGGVYTHPKEFLQVISVLMYLERLGLDIDQKLLSKEKVEAYIDEFIIPNITDEAHWTLYGSHFAEGLGSSYDSLGYFSREEPQFIAVQEYLDKKLREWRQNWEANSVSHWLTGLMKEDYPKFLGNLMFVNSPSEQRYLRHPILKNVDPKQFVDTWLTLPQKEERLLVGCFAERYDYHSELLVDETPWWTDVSKVLEDRMKTEKVKPRAIQMGILIEAINNRLINHPKQPAQVGIKAQ